MVDARSRQLSDSGTGEFKSTDHGSAGFGNYTRYYTSVNTDLIIPV